MGLLSEAADATVGVPSPRRRAQFESVQRSSRKGWKSKLFIGIDVLSHPRTARLSAWLEPQWQQEGKGQSNVDFVFGTIVC